MAAEAREAVPARPSGYRTRRIVDHSVAALGEKLESIYGELMTRRRPSNRRERSEPLADRPWILCDLHMHTEFSHDCSVPVADLLDEAERLGLGAIAVTDHNVFGGARLAVEISAQRATLTRDSRARR